MPNHIRFAIGLAAGLGTFVIASALMESDAPATALPEYWPAPAFELLDQEGDSLRRSDLLGSVWVASFIFTSCADVCPGISARMARLGEELREERVLGAGVRLVSFTVDPERDSPDVLREYAQGFGGLEPAEWAFVTGTRPDSVRAMIQTGFHLTAMKPGMESDDGGRAESGSDSGHDAHAAEASYQVMHSPRVLLVDRYGSVRGIYDATDSESMNAILGDALALLND
ncbi:MAG TPA: SCO family protein [Longimicrobiales bacterium]|nr:SCO family protein [Longimicrobiales bacterium]